MRTHVSDIDIDLTDSETFAATDLGAFWRRLRREAPVCWHPATGDCPGFWVVSRHADVTAVYKDPVTFTSEKGNVLVTLLAGEDSAAGKMCAVTDGVRHQEMRNALLKSFSPKVIAKLRERIWNNTHRLVAAATRKGECEFAAEVSERIPMTTISDLLGVPESDRDFLLSRNRAALSSDTPRQSREDAWTARNDILLYFAELMEQRRGRDFDDVISVLANTVIGGKPLTAEEVVLNCYSLILAGDETSRLTMNDVVYALAHEPEQWTALKEGRADPKLACEEALRWATPAMHFGRTATTSAVLAEQEIHPGQIVTAWLSSANRDESVFAEPDRFDLGRTPNRHVSFGYGPHFCIGAYLARLEVTALLAALRRYVVDFEVSGEVTYFHSNFLRGLSRLPLRCTPVGAR